MTRQPDDAPIWSPATERIARTNLTAFITHLRASGLVHAETIHDYASLYDWSVEQPASFWPAVARFCGIKASSPGPDPWDPIGFGLDRMAPPHPKLGPRWFPTARFNFAENLLRRAHKGPAVIALGESRPRRELSWTDLRETAARVAAALDRHGIRPGDRVAAYLPNIPEAVVALLGAASRGAIWSCCAPDFGVAGVVDRFGQIRPRVLLTVDGYRYAGKGIDLRERIARIRAQIPDIERVVVIPYLESHPDLARIPDAVLWDEWLEPSSGVMEFERLPFDHPLYILYSSGTTGLPKCMVHGAGGTLLQHQKEHVLHVDLSPADRLFYYTTTGWMMWNWLVSALAAGTCIVLYDGAPLAPVATVLWDLVAQEGVTVFGTSAKYLALAEKAGLEPAHTHDLSALRTILSTGSPLGAHSYAFVYDRVKPDVHLANMSGGTELISCFALGDPTSPVWRGELQARGLGMAVEIWDDDRKPTRERPGELVCTKPFPSMPVSFWDDPEGARYRAAYFAHFPGVWRHGDWAELTPHNGLVIHGRSDATLNPGGIRIGTAEIYRQVESMPEVLECLAVAHEVEGDVRILLFLRLAEGVTLDDNLRDRIRQRLREQASPHHVPHRIVQVSDLPRTISGKISELAVRAIIHGRQVTNREALANPDALEQFRDLSGL